MSDNWYKYLDPRFCPGREKIRMRDRWPTVCTQCSAVSTTKMANLRLQVNRIGTHLCWSCSSKKGALKRWERG